MEQVKFLHLMIVFVQIAEGFIWNSSTTSIHVCVGNSISLTWVYTLESGESHSLTSWTKSDGAGGLIDVADSFGGLSPAAGYVGRLTRIGNAGLQISNAASLDNGTYIVIVALTSGTEYRMNATAHVHGNATTLCKPTCDSSLKCWIPENCTVKSYIDAVWTVEGVKYPSEFPCLTNNYNKLYNVCAEGEAITSCYNLPSLWCEQHMCKAATTTATVQETREASTSSIINTSTINTSTINTSTAKQVANDSHQLVIIISVSISVGVLLLVTVIIIICCCLHHHRKRNKDQTKHKANHTIARNGQNELHNVRNTSQVDSCLDMSKIPKTKSDKGKSNEQILSSTHI